MTTPVLADAATWAAVAVALGAAVVALAALTLLAVVLRRARSSERPRAEEARRGVARLASEFAEGPDPGHRARLFAEIASTVELDDVLERALGAAAALARVDAAMLAVRAGEAEPLLATIGLTPEEASRQPVSASPSGSARAVSISYRYDPEQERARQGEEGVVRGGVAVPVREDGETPLGTLAVFWRRDDAAPTDEEVAALEELAGACAPAIRNAQRFREARLLAGVDPLTGLQNRRSFEETLERECIRAHRYERRLALAVLDVDDFTSMNERLGPAAGDEVLAAVARRLAGAVRGSDVACRVGGDEFAVILPESGSRDAERLYHRVQFAVGSGAAGPVERVRMSAGIAELRSEDDAVSLFRRADEALDAAKQEGKGQLRKANGSAGP